MIDAWLEEFNNVVFTVACKRESVSQHGHFIENALRMERQQYDI